jgi:hypothetical protein
MAPDGFHHLEGVLTPSGAFRFYLYDDFTRPKDPRTVEGRLEGGTVPPLVTPDYLEFPGSGEPEGIPAERVLFVRFAPDGPEERFDFVFVGEGETATAELTPFRIPDTAEEMRVALLARVSRLQEMMRRGLWNELYIPALEAKDIALALYRAKPVLAAPVKRIVRGAWLLDIYGDLGNRIKVEAAYQIFLEGIDELKEADES